MSIYISIIEAGQEPQLLRARGIWIGLSRGPASLTTSKNGPLEVTSPKSKDPLFYVLASDAGWAVLPANKTMQHGHNQKIFAYGSAGDMADYGDSYPDFSFAVTKLDFDLNADGNIDDMLSNPVAKVEISLFGDIQTTWLRRGDLLPIGSNFFPLPYQEQKTQCSVFVTANNELIFTAAALHSQIRLNGSALGSANQDPKILNSKTNDGRFSLEGEGWLVTGEFARGNIKANDEFSTLSATGNITE